MSAEVDLEGFPLLRLDQLPLISDTLLRDAIAEVQQTLSGDCSESLGGYLQKQLSKMREELQNRRPSVVPACNEQPRSAVEAIGSIPAPNNNQKQQKHRQQERLMHRRSAGQMKPNGWLRSTLAPQLGSAQPSAAVVPFVVQATERSRRMLPKKAPEVSREEKLEAERAARREAAMERLQARKLRRQAMQQRQQAQNRARRKAAGSRPSSSRSSRRPASPRTDKQSSSSDSESVSGGDDELDDPSDNDAGRDSCSDKACVLPAPADVAEWIGSDQGVAAENTDQSGDAVSAVSEATEWMPEPSPRAAAATMSSEEATQEPLPAMTSDSEQDSMLSNKQCTEAVIDEHTPAVRAEEGIAERRADGTGCVSETQPVRTDSAAADDELQQEEDRAAEPLGPETIVAEKLEKDERQEEAELPNNRRNELLGTAPIEAVATEDEPHDLEVEDVLAVASCSSETTEAGTATATTAATISVVELEAVVADIPRPAEIHAKAAAETDVETEVSDDGAVPATANTELVPPTTTGAVVVAEAEETGPKYTDYFRSFLHLFSGLYCTAGEISVESTTYRTLTAALEHQQKLYMEWVEIMKDFELIMPSSLSSPAEAAASSLANGGQRFASEQYFRVNSTRSEVARIVKDAMSSSCLSTKWNELPEGFGLKTTWNLLWTWSKPRINSMHLLACQKVNHFRDIRQLTRKDLLKKNIERWSRLGAEGKQFQIMPLTFWLPHEYTSFVSAFTQAGARNPQQNIWIMKPIGLSRGRGISLVSDINDLVYSQEVVMQQYIANPLLLDGYKFDLRLYVLVTSFQPLEAFIYKDGFARLSTRKYCTDSDKLGDLFIHLTNSSIQTVNEEGIKSDNPVATADAHDSGGTKLSLSETWRLLQAKGLDTNALWQRICEVVVKSLVCVDDKIPHQPSAFELFGYDVILDDTLQPWLLEVNSSPSMARGSALDRRIKDAVIRDTIALVNPLPYDRMALLDALTRRVNEVRKKGPAAILKAGAALEADLAKIFMGNFPRRCGELPNHMGNFERLCPGTSMYVQAMRLRRNLSRLGPLPVGYQTSH